MPRKDERVPRADATAPATDPSPAEPSTKPPTKPSAEPLAVIGPDGTPASAGDAPETEEDVEARLAYESLMRHRKARRRKKIVAGAVVGGIALVAAIAWGVIGGQSSQAPDAAPLQTIPVTRGEFSESVQATGAAQPLSSVIVTPEVDGIIETVNVAEGSTVNEGDVLLTIRNDELDRAVRSAQIDVQSAEAAVAQSQEAYNATWRAWNAGVTEPEGEATTKAMVQQAQADLDGKKLQLESAREALDTATSNAAKRTVKAPTSGSVVVMNAVSGAALGAGASGGSANAGTMSGSGGPLVQIADLSQMTVKVQVNEVDISRVSVGQAARVTFSALPGVMLDAQVTRISTVSTMGDGMTGAYGVVTYDVELLIPEPVPELKPGMTASVEIMQQYVPDALTVPSSALMTDDGTNYYVYVMVDPATEALERRDVTVPAQSETSAVVEGNVTEGDLVVLDPFAVDPASVAGGDPAAAGEPASPESEGTADEKNDGSPAGDDGAADATGDAEPATGDGATPAGASADHS